MDNDSEIDACTTVLGGEPLRRLRAVTVDLWICPLNGEANLLDHLVLSEAERWRATRLHRLEDAADFVTVRAALRRRLGHLLGVEPQIVNLIQSPGGRPELAGAATDPAEPPLSFNVSHTAGRALIAISQGAVVGCDIERLTPVDDALLQVIFSDQERAQIAAVRPDGKLRAIFRAWTRKEALLKAAGLGLSTDPVTVDLTSIMADPVAGSRGWQIVDLPVGDAWQAAVAVAAYDRNILWRVHTTVDEGEPGPTGMT
jgi:4'-phosphopantetheinyl transferase